MLRLPAAVTLVFLTCVSALAQSAKPGLSFEVASVKIAGPYVPGPGGPRGGPGTNDPTRITYSRANLQTLLVYAYDVRPDQISGPGWLQESDDRTMYSITAVMPPNTTKEQLNVMLQNLLKERFHLALHHESKEFSGYDLVVSGRPKIKQYNPQARAGDGSGPDDKRFPRLGPGATASIIMPPNGTWAMLRTRQRVTMAQFARSLGGAINESNGREMTASTPRVADKTGLQGVYEFTLEFAGMLLMPGSPPPAAGDPGEIGPSIFTAIENQLGLKLVKTKNVPVDILVIDRADKVPTGN